MKFEIEIKEGHDYSSYFWFRPVMVPLREKIRDDDVTELDEEFSIEEEDVDCFLAHFFYKHFDSELAYNKNRYDEFGFISGFVWNLTYNFFTFDGIRALAADIEGAAELLEKDYDNPALDEVKKRFSIYYMCPHDDIDYIEGNSENIRNHADVVTDFYRRFAKRILQMLDSNPDADLISIMGP